MDVKRLLKQVQDSEISLEEAESLLKKLPYEDIGIARLDHHRKLRAGVGEVVFCQGKVDNHLLSIFQRLMATNSNFMGTRASQEQYELLSREIPQVAYDAVSRILSVTVEPVQKVGKIVVCTGGTADIPVAEEAAQTAEFFGNHVERLYDVGVAGIHRLFSQMEVFDDANCVIAVAGMEGALGSVVAGLVDKPVIAVPTSVGYGANFNGLSALLTMINSCANGISVVNIDNGYGAGYVGAQINRVAVGQTI